ncbi:Retinol dehydrogenase 14 [Saguinus oedipus]|uniref:Retinol dehydrogenase 14 n=1 Tax=Saguinus oedipus TaxID=9490 RepID=A0ABQ9WAB6_SAGOE|nr:Retinol dehydrogenase 14 [Saguinus oedipus]
MAVDTAAVLAAPGGALWLAARRFVGFGVQRLRRGGDPGLLHWKTRLITGANSGLGGATALELLRLGMGMIMGYWDRARARAEEAAGQLCRELRQAAECRPEPGIGEADELIVRELDPLGARLLPGYAPGRA